MVDIKVAVAAHKSYKMPCDELYLPVQAGSKGKESIGFVRDDQNDSISEKNSSFCELTVLYWVWKNVKCDYFGLCHYRRHFSLKSKPGADLQNVLSKKQAEEIFKKTDVILPKKRNYFIESIYDHYSHTHGETSLVVLRDIISEKYPDYLSQFDMLKKRTSGHMFNMFIMKREIADAYLAWLFDILFEAEKRIDVTGLDSFDARVFGRLSEILLDVYLNKNSVDYKEVNFVYTEKVDVVRKIKSFLSAKFLGKRYSKSF